MAEELDFTFVSLEQLKEAIYSRVDDCVVIYKRNEDIGDPVVMCCSKNGSLSGVGLCEVGKEFFLKRTIEGSSK